MDFNPKCKHEEGFYLCATPSHPTHWMMWCCSARCGHCQTKHPDTGLEYPHKPNSKPGPVMSQYKS